jgi:hypothetical protein
MARPYRAARRVAFKLRVLAGSVAAVIVPARPDSIGAMGSRLVVLKERYEEALRESTGRDSVEWMAIEARVNALKGTPSARVSPREVDALMTAMDEWTRRRSRCPPEE